MSDTPGVSPHPHPDPTTNSSTHDAGPVGDSNADVEQEEAPRDAARSGGRPRSDRFRTFVAVGIALLSIVGAAIAYRGSVTTDAATRIEQDGLHEAVQQQRILTEYNLELDEDLRGLPPYQEAREAARILGVQADALAAEFPELGALLRAQAAGEEQLATARFNDFLVQLPNGPTDGAPATYDKEGALQRLKTEDDELSKLHPQAMVAQASHERAVSVDLMLLVTLSVAAVVFLTLAQFVRRTLRRLFAGSGAVVGVLAVLLWILVEWRVA
jgi:hypothetical protein